MADLSIELFIYWMIKAIWQSKQEQVCLDSNAEGGLRSKTRGLWFASLFFLLTFNLIFILYWHIVDTVCQCQVDSTVIQLHIYMCLFFFRFFSHIGYYRILSIPCATQQVLTDYLFYIYQCVYVNPKLLIYPSPYVSPLVPSLAELGKADAFLQSVWRNIL